jgi:16S rRNA (guanine527-N7)-methyltransferase
VADSLRGLASHWRAELGPAQERSIQTFLELLLTWNARINLTGARSLADLIAEHLPDSFAMIGLVPQGVRLVDVGSGAGLPAIPFAILRPDVSVELVEPRAKRVAFLRTAVRELGLPKVTVTAGRADALPPATYDVATSRATFAPVEWLGLGRRLVRAGGRVLVFAPSAVPPPEGLAVEAAVNYDAGRRRWLGAFCST